MNLPTAEQSALFIQKEFGGRPQFRGFHSISGSMTKSDGTIIPLLHFEADEVTGATIQRGAPEMVSVAIDAPLQAVADLIGKKRKCALDLILVSDACLSPALKQRWLGWGTTDPAITILIPQAYIEQRGLENLASREGNQPPVSGNLQLKFLDWQILRSGAAVLVNDLVNDTTITGIAATACGEGSCMMWYAATAEGGMYTSADSGVTWSALPISSEEWSNGGVVYADERVIMLGGDNGINASFGVQVSYDRGDTWTRSTIAHATGGLTGNVTEILRTGYDYVVCTGAGIYRTYDRGVSWQKTCSATDFVACEIDNTGFGVAVRPTELWATTDGGMHWTALTGSPGSSMRDVAINGGYVHIVDSAAGYFRAPIGTVRYSAPAWTLMDATAEVIKIAFQSRLIGYRLRDIGVDRTINGGYSWEMITPGISDETLILTSATDFLAVSDSSISLAEDGSTRFSVLTICGDHVLMSGITFVAHYNPFYETEVS